MDKELCPVCGDPLTEECLCWCGGVVGLDHMMDDKGYCVACGIVDPDQVEEKTCPK